MIIECLRSERVGANPAADGPYSHQAGRHSTQTGVSSGRRTRCSWISHLAASWRPDHSHRSHQLSQHIRLYEDSREVEEVLPWRRHPFNDHSARIYRGIQRTTPFCVNELTILCTFLLTGAWGKHRRKRKLRTGLSIDRRRLCRIHMLRSVQTGNHNRHFRASGWVTWMRRYSRLLAFRYVAKPWYKQVNGVEKVTRWERIEAGWIHLLLICCILLL